MSKRGWLLLGALGIIWGTPYLFIRIAVEEFSPAFVVFIRMLIGVAVLFPIAIRAGQYGVFRTHRKGILLFGFLEIAIPFGVLGIAEQKISSSLAGMLIATVPIVNAIMAHRLHMDRDWNKKRILGLLIGLVGVSLLVGFEIKSDNWWSVAIVSFAILGYAAGPILITKYLSDIPSSGVIGWAQLIVLGIYTPIVGYEFFTGSWKNVSQVHLDSIISVLALGFFCTALAFILLFKLVEEAGPSKTTIVTYLNPAVAVLLGVLILQEKLTLGIMLAFPIILIGSFLAAGKSN